MGAQGRQRGQPGEVSGGFLAEGMSETNPRLRRTFQAKVEQRTPQKEAERVARRAVRRPGPRGNKGKRRQWQKPGWKGERDRGRQRGRSIKIIQCTFSNMHLLVGSKLEFKNKKIPKKSSHI